MLSVRHRKLKNLKYIILFKWLVIYFDIRKLEFEILTYLISWKLKTKNVNSPDEWWTMTGRIAKANGSSLGFRRPKTCVNYRHYKQYHMFISILYGVNVKCERKKNYQRTVSGKIIYHKYVRLCDNRERKVIFFYTMNSCFIPTMV